MQIRLLLVLSALAPALRADEFFESKIRPVLVEHCHSCHSGATKNPKGGLRLDSRIALLAGGDSGPAIVVKQPATSKLIEAIRYSNTDLQMPPKGKLPDNVIKDFEKWIADGAVWPGDQAEPQTTATGFDLFKRKAEHWAWQPVRVPMVPAVKNKAWLHDELDAFILEKLEEKGLAPAPPAEKSVWLRRVTFTLTGLPPTVAEIEAFLTDNSPDAFEKVVDRLLASPHYGEYWARHWLDLVRYAESRGHEFDFDIPNTWLYRDYVARAFNDDRPYNDFVYEQICGTTRDGPRWNADRSVNESAIATMFWRLGEEVHSPVDIRQDEADRFDNRIDVFGKAFLGLTIACARCHDHKFDAISTRDYYSLFALLRGGCDALIRIDHQPHNTAIARGRQEILRRAAPAVHRSHSDEARHDEWKKSTNLVIDYSASSEPNRGDVGFADFTMRRVVAGECSEILRDGQRLIRREERGALVFDTFWRKLAAAKGMLREPGRLGEWPRAGFTIYSPTIQLTHNNVFLLIRGGCHSYAAVGHHAVINGPLHGALVRTFPNQAEYRWVRHPLRYHKGRTFRLQISADPETDFALAMIAQGDQEPSMPPQLTVPPLSAKRGESLLAELAKLPEPVWESRIIPGVMDAFATDERVFIRGNHRVQGEPAPPRFLQALGNYDFQLKDGEQIGDYERLARQVSDPRFNPMLGRVMVNRVWHHVFGRGIVASTDNFGVLGERPTHPELLDYLATNFEQGGWRLKPFLKRLVLSSTFRMESRAVSHPSDPGNVLLHHFRVRRLEAESLRDAILHCSGRLDRTVGGPPIPQHLTTFHDGRGRPSESGPRDGDGRRSLYLAVRRNFLSPFLLTFDAPIPFSTVGTRQVSNVPAQALILMNDPFVHEQAKRWGTIMAAKPGSTDTRIREMYITAFAREPSAEEIAVCRSMIGSRAETWVDLAHSLMNVKEFRYVP